MSPLSNAVVQEHLTSDVITVGVRFNIRFVKNVAYYSWGSIGTYIFVLHFCLWCELNVRCDAAPGNCQIDSYSESNSLRAAKVVDGSCRCWSKAALTTASTSNQWRGICQQLKEINYECKKNGPPNAMRELAHRKEENTQWSVIATSFCIRDLDLF